MCQSSRSGENSITRPNGGLGLKGCPVIFPLAVLTQPSYTQDFLS